jgi:hypothetical protein
MIYVKESDCHMQGYFDDIFYYLDYVRDGGATTISFFEQLSLFSFLSRVANGYVAGFSKMEDRLEVLFVHTRYLDIMLHTINDTVKSDLPNMFADFLQLIFDTFDSLHSKYMPLFSCRKTYNDHTVELVNQAVDDYYNYR